MKVLVVDDDNNLCRLYKEELEGDGYNVVTATTGTNGMELFQKEFPDLVTLDINMSYADEGIDLLRQMKQVNPTVPVIMLTAYDCRDDFKIWCADAYIVKSSDLSVLKNAIKSRLA